MRPSRAKIRRLLRFVLDLVPSHYLPERLDVVDFEGAAVHGEAGAGEVEIRIPEHAPRYPRHCEYRAGAGALRFNCFCEEFVAVVAHELRHIAQERTPKIERPKHYEVDAEAFARFAVEIFRQKRRCRCE